MKKDEFVNEVAKKVGFTKTDVNKVIDVIQEVIVEECIEQGGEVNLPKIGRFRRRIIPAHRGYNPITKQSIKLPETHVLTFKAAAGVKKTIEAVKE